MAQLNRFGAVLGKLPYVKALTDVTGFGLLGHLTEMAEGSALSALINFEAVPKLAMVEEYLAQKSFPGGTMRNLESYSHKISALTDIQKYILADPQTSGGLLIAVEPGSCDEFERVALENGITLHAFGELVEQREKVVYVN